MFLLLFKLFTSLLNDLLVKFFALFLIFLTQLSSQLHLLVKNVSHLLLSFLVLHLLIFNLLLMETLSESLHFTPFVFTDVGGYVFYFDCCHVVWQLAQCCLRLATGRAHFSYHLQTLLSKIRCGVRNVLIMAHLHLLMILHIIQHSGSLSLSNTILFASQIVHDELVAGRDRDVSQPWHAHVVFGERESTIIVQLILAALIL